MDDDEIDSHAPTEAMLKAGARAYLDFRDSPDPEMVALVVWDAMVKAEKNEWEEIKQVALEHAFRAITPAVPTPPGPAPEWDVDTK